VLNGFGLVQMALRVIYAARCTPPFGLHGAVVPQLYMQMPDCPVTQATFECTATLNMCSSAPAQLSDFVQTCSPPRSTVSVKKCLGQRHLYVPLDTPCEVLQTQLLPCCMVWPQAGSLKNATVPCEQSMDVSNQDLGRTRHNNATGTQFRSEAACHITLLLNLRCLLLF
jgi:hypothetical protein